MANVLQCISKTSATTVNWNNLIMIAHAFVYGRHDPHLNYVWDYFTIIENCV